MTWFNNSFLILIDVDNLIRPSKTRKTWLINFLSFFIVLIDGNSHILNFSFIIIPINRIFINRNFFFLFILGNILLVIIIGNTFLIIHLCRILTKWFNNSFLILIDVDNLIKPSMTRKTWLINFLSFFILLIDGNSHILNFSFFIIPINRILINRNFFFLFMLGNILLIIFIGNTFLIIHLFRTLTTWFNNSFLILIDVDYLIRPSMTRKTWLINFLSFFILLIDGNSHILNFGFFIIPINRILINRNFFFLFILGNILLIIFIGNTFLIIHLFRNLTTWFNNSFLILIDVDNRIRPSRTRKTWLINFLTFFILLIDGNSHNLNFSFFIIPINRILINRNFFFLFMLGNILLIIFIGNTFLIIHLFRTLMKWFNNSFLILIDVDNLIRTSRTRKTWLINFLSFFILLIDGNSHILNFSFFIIPINRILINRNFFFLFMLGNILLIIFIGNTFLIIHLFRTLTTWFINSFLILIDVDNLIRKKWLLRNFLNFFILLIDRNSHILNFSFFIISINRILINRNFFFLFMLGNILLIIFISNTFLIIHLCRILTT